jgi:predicted nucleic acid-binding protein
LQKFFKFDDNKIKFFAPEFTFIEIENVFDAIKKKSILPEKDLKIWFSSLKSRIQLINEYKIPKRYVKLAIEIVKDVDEDDVFFIALHLFLKHKIWTLDKKLIKGVSSKGYPIFINTKEILTNLKMKK